MISELRDRALFAQVILIDRAQRLVREVVARLPRLRDDEAGQTPTEYLMIVGLMAVVIVVVFVNFYWKNVRGSASSWVGNVKQSIVGTSIK